MIKPNKKVMKKVSKVLGMVAMVATMFLVGCKGGDPIPPTISFSTGSAVSALTGETVTVTVDITAGDEDLSSMTVIDPSLGADSTVTLFGTADVYTYEVTIPASFTDSVAVVTFDVTDAEGTTASADLTISIASGSPTTRECVDHRMGAQLANPGSFYSSSQDSVYSTANAKLSATDVDISFAELDSAGSPTLISPDYRDTEGLSAFPDASETNAQVTYFALSTLDPATATDADIDAIVASSNKSVGVTDGETYEFVNEAGKKGLIKVTNYTSGSAGAPFSGEMTATVRVQD